MEKIYIAEVRKKREYLKAYAIAYKYAYSWKHPECILNRLISKKPFSSLIYIDTEEKTFRFVGGITVCAVICTAYRGRILNADNLETVFKKRSKARLGTKP